MNRRKKKKAFKKRFGFNPPRNVSIWTAMQIMEHKENIIAIFNRLKAAILNLWEQVKKPASELAEALEEREVRGIEGNSDIYNHDRR